MEFGKESFIDTKHGERESAVVPPCVGLRDELCWGVGCSSGRLLKSCIMV